MPQRVLLVTDIPDHIPHYAAGLHDAGYSVTVSTSATEALGKAVAETPSCIVIDERVSDMSGWDLCKRLRADLRVRSTPIVMLTQSMGEELVDMDDWPGCNSWLALPATPDYLLKVVEHVLNRRTTGPRSDREAAIELVRCPACDSEHVRASVRVGATQYYCCASCTLNWRDTTEPA